MSSDPEQPSELLRRVEAGDDGAMGALLEHYRPMLLAMAHRRIQGDLRARVDESDLVQQTCLSAYRDFGRSPREDGGQFEAWLVKIHQRNIQDAIRDHAILAKRAVSREEAIR